MATIAAASQNKILDPIAPPPIDPA